MTKLTHVGDSLTVRAGTAADSQRILELVRTSLGEGTIPRERAYWEWKHFQNPFGTSPMLLAEADGQLVGLRVFMRWSWQADGKPISAVRAVDTATHPAWQGKGIFKRLTLSLVEQMRDEGVAFVFNTPNEQSRPGYLKMGWFSLGRTDLWIRPRKPFRAAWRVVRRRFGYRLPGGLLPEETGQFPDVGSLLAEPGIGTMISAGERRQDRRFTTRHSPEFLRWRYQTVPGFKYYGVSEASLDGSAAAIFRFKEQGPLLELRICELMTDGRPGATRVLGMLLRRLCRVSGADYVSAMGAEKTPERGALLRAGFLPAKNFGPILTVRPLLDVNRGADPLNKSSWRASIGDLELF